jgi:hypothetical protein
MQGADELAVFDPSVPERTVFVRTAAGERDDLFADTKNGQPQPGSIDRGSPPSR